ncbi:MAG TPA: hypothetical protein VLY63_15785 [Anaerolineae bacterium]|nr:hypothetical protein [Anaerolineae bacterium]
MSRVQSPARFRAFLQMHREFILILVLAAAFRLMSVLVFRPGGYVGEMSDFGYYRLMLSFTSQGYYPLIDFWVEYPPVVPWLMVGLYRLSLLIPAWSEPGAWFYLLLSTALAIAEIASLIVFYAIARRLYDQKHALRLTWIYVALLIPVLALFVGFDGLALLFLLWAVLLTLDQRPVASGVAAGLGFMTKLVPIAAAPAALQHMKRRSQRVRYLLAISLTILVIALPFLFTAPDFLIQSLKSPVVRSTWETVWALIDGYYSYGVAGGWDRFDPAMAGAAQHPTQLPWWLITIGFGLFYLALYTRRVDWADRRRAVAFTALTQNLLTLYFKGYSPQFLVMLLPFLILLLPGWRGIAYALLLSAINLVEYPLYFLVLPEEHWLLAGTVLLRTLILIVVSVEYAAQIYNWRITEQRWRQLAAGIVVLVVVLGLVGAAFGFQAYAQSQYASSPHRPVMDLLAERAAPGAPLVTDQQLTYEQLYPLLRKHFNVRLVETHTYLPPWEPRLAETAALPGGQLWVYAPTSSPLHSWMADQYPPITSHEFDGWLLSGWDTR